MNADIPIIIEEKDGIERVNEPVTVGIPLPAGLFYERSALSLVDSEHGTVPLQADVLAVWPDKSLKWVLLDFQVSLAANHTKELKLTLDDTAMSGAHAPRILIEDNNGTIQIDTGAATFVIDAKCFRPFEQVIVNNSDLLDSSGSTMVLTDTSGNEYEPKIDNICFETKGSLRTTLNIAGSFQSGDGAGFADFLSRLSFYADSAVTKIEFTILNSGAARHPGGLWDLGDAGSIYFKDLTMHTALSSDHDMRHIISYQLNDEANNVIEEISRKSDSEDSIVLYQDSSGGENWMSRNHVNRNNEVRNTFRGYRIYSGEDILKEGRRVSPVLSLKDDRKGVACAIQYFWQNSPKSLEASGETLIARLFPKHYDDNFELQGGEQKTHTLFFDFGCHEKNNGELRWIHAPLLPRSIPEWYSKSKAFSYLLPEDDDPDQRIRAFINTAIQGDNTFFDRREIIDEYGWRHFGELYADHEAVRHEGAEPLISHYNNQYDCIYGFLLQFTRSGDRRWFLLADQLCRHVKDIDIYNTEDDRPEFNYGLFWHTEHYLDAQTATHRCFSKKHELERDLSFYGGGPSLSHNYSTGLAVHYYLTGDESSKKTVMGLAAFVMNNMAMECTLSSYSIKLLRNVTDRISRGFRNESFVSINKVYSMEGPSRASGNSLNTLVDAYMISSDGAYLLKAEELICSCVHPDDDIGGRDLLDVENRWMYTVFLQALGRYLDIKTEQQQFDHMWHYARRSIMSYAVWIIENEHPYLDRPEKLQFPTETWAVQDLRKCNVLLYACKYADAELEKAFRNKADYFYNESLRRFDEFDTKALTRPIALLMQNGMMHNWWGMYGTQDMKSSFRTYIKDERTFTKPRESLFHALCKILRGFSLGRELRFLRWRFMPALK